LVNESNLHPKNFGASPGALQVDIFCRLFTWAIEFTVAATKNGRPKIPQSPIKTVKTNKSKWYPCPLLNLFSFLLTITAVICWSIKINMTPKRAGGNAKPIDQIGLINNGTSQEFLEVGFIDEGTWSFVVFRPTNKSSRVVTAMANTTEKSAISARTYLQNVITIWKFMQFYNQNLDFNFLIKIIRLFQFLD